MKKNITRRSKLKSYGSGFSTRPYSSIDKLLFSLKARGPEIPNASNPCYESFLLSSLWYQICQKRWPHLSITDKIKEKTAGSLIYDWTREFLMVGTRFDLGPFEIMVGLRTPIATAVSIRRDIFEVVYLSIGAEDKQSAEDIMNEETILYLSTLLKKLEIQDCLLDFRGDCFFVCKTPHTDGLYVLERLLDLLESLYSGDNLCILS